MKYFYVLMPAMLCFFIGHAQINKGQVLLGGNVQFSNNNNKLPAPNFSKANTTMLGPSIGWAIKDNLELGGRFLYSHAKTDEYFAYPQQNPQYVYRQYDESTDYGFAVYIRRYKDLGHGFAFYAEGDLNGSTGREKQETDTIPGLYMDQKSWSAGASFTGGIIYRLARRWMVEAGFVNLISATYTHTSDKGEDANSNYAPSKSNRFAIGTNLSQPLSNFSFGCRYLL